MAHRKSLPVEKVMSWHRQAIDKTQTRQGMCVQTHNKHRKRGII